MPYVNSRAISRIEYNETTSVLSITFRTSGTYDYYNVPNSVYCNFLEASSKGRFFNDFIREQYGL